MDQNNTRIKLFNNVAISREESQQKEVEEHED